MSCDKNQPDLYDVALGASASSGLAAHLGECSRCRTVLDRERALLGRIDREVQAALAVSPAPLLQMKVRDRIVREEPTRAAGTWGLILGVAAVFVAAAIGFLTRSLPPALSPPPTALSPPSVSRAPSEPAAVAPPSEPLAPAPAVAKGDHAEARRSPSRDPEPLVPPHDDAALWQFIATIRGRVVGSEPQVVVEPVLVHAPSDLASASEPSVPEAMGAAVPIDVATIDFPALMTDSLKE